MNTRSGKVYEANRMENDKTVGPEQPSADVAGSPAEMAAVNTTSSTLQGEVTPSVAGTRASSRSQGSTRTSREAQRRRAEYAAQIELAKIQENLVKSRLAMEIAEIDEQEIDELGEEHTDVDATAKVTNWLQETADPARQSQGGQLGNGVDVLPKPENDRVRRTALASQLPAAGVKQKGDPSPSARRRSEVSAHVRLTKQRDANVPTRSTHADLGCIEMQEVVEAIKSAARPKPLPRQTYELPPFNGNPADWLAFKRTYRHSSDLYNFEAFENIARLQSALQGAAKVAVEDLLRTSEDPDEIVQALEDEFGHPGLLLECALGKVRALSKVSDSGKEIRSFATTVRNCLSLLKSIQAQGYINNPQLVSDILSKLTPYQRAQYGDYVLRRDNDTSADLRVTPSLEVLVDFLSDLSRASAYYAPATASILKAVPSQVTSTSSGARGVERGRDRNARVVHKVMTHAEVNKKDDKDNAKCGLCSLSHSLVECKRFGEMDTKDRWVYVKNNKLCFKCLVKKHSKYYCRAKRCDECKLSHHSLLHEDNPEIDKNASASVTERVTSVGEMQSRALLKVMPVTIITDSGKAIDTYALLDDGATVSIIDSAYVRDCEGVPAPLRVMTARGQCVEDKDSRRVKLRLRGTNGWCHTIYARSMRDVNLPPQTVTARVLEENSHLRGLDCAVMEGAKPGILLGQDNWELIVGAEVKRGKTGKPVASLTRLGWVVHGPLGTSLSSTDSVNCIQQCDANLDYLDSVDTIDKAELPIRQVSGIHRNGGFEIRGWVTNHPGLRAVLPDVSPAPVSLEKSQNTVERTLGLMWAPGEDMLTFDLSFKRLPADIVNGKVIPTKRQFLSFIMSIYDPLGFLYPCVIQSRILMQRVWKSGIRWDDQLAEAEATLWSKWLAALQQLKDVRIPRWYDITGKKAELHVFADASEQAYAAVAYIVGENKHGEKTIAMVIAKARVAPVKVVSIPRLELQAAVLACRLAETVRKEINITIVNNAYWTDSKTVLAWINNDNKEYQKYVSHRLAEIDQATRRSEWRWVPSELNPADEATKLSWPNTQGLWVSGPPFLRCSQVQWPGGEQSPLPETSSEIEREHRLLVAAEPSASIIEAERYSTWARALRVTARVLAFIDACRHRQSAAVTAAKLREAETCLLRQVQATSFAEEIGALRAGRALPASSRLRSLDPMLYEDGLLRVRGRLSSAPNLSFEEKHPTILDGRHPLVRLLLRAYHERALHANHEAVLNHLRERFWILRARPAVKAMVAHCQRCRIRRARPIAPKMGNLPPARLADTRRAFVNCGVDYFGPMEVTLGRRREKRWGVLFTCLATRAIHLELAASLTADSAILALRRLVARRGRPARIYSDCGTNFVGAHNELRAALRTLDHERVCEDATAHGIEWTFQPPAAPHMSGVWERMVRAVKDALRTTLRERAPREEVLYTLLLEAELVVNSRPLAYVSSDHDEPTVITPNHLLLGTSAGDTQMTARDPNDVDARSQWRRVNALANMFWRRWLRQYVPTLQRRQKWTVDSPPVHVNDIVVVADSNLPRSVWPKGIIVRVHPGKDGIVRIVDIKTSHGVLRRPVLKCIALPTDGTVLG